VSFRAEREISDSPDARFLGAQTAPRNDNGAGVSFRAEREISDSRHTRFLVAPSAPRNDKDAAGVLLTAHSGVGKTTASNRLPAPWIALCDDTTLIVRDDAGAYWAHPMPTWSQIFREEKITSWDTQAAVPLRAIFLLRQAEADRVMPLGAAHAIGFLLERAQEPAEYWREDLSLAELGAFNTQVFDNLRHLLRAVPCYLLDARVDGEFWKEIERVIE
jgi:SynChlorMet cassette protein ScmC